MGHLVLATEAAAQLGLDEVLLIPTGEAPHKRIDPEPGPQVRLEMARLAAAGDDLLEVSDLEVRRDGPSFSFRTLELLSEQRPDADLHFLMGADIAAQLESWRRPERVLELARVGLAARPGSDIAEAEAALERLGAGDRTDVVEMPALGVSSTQIRCRIARGRSIRYLVCDAVAALIAERGLYSEAVIA